MKWDLHIKYTVNKLRTILYEFRKLKVILPLTHLKTLYHLNTRIHSIEVIQRRFFKLIFSRSSRCSSDILYTKTKILDIRLLYFLCTSIKYHANKHTALLPFHQYNTRQQDHYVTPLMVKVAAQRSYSFFAPKLYNIIPETIKSIKNNDHFKKELKKHILQSKRIELQRIFH